MFANMDPRQRETLFRIVNECCQNTDFQYICSINEDALLSFQSMMGEEEYKNRKPDIIYVYGVKDYDTEMKQFSMMIKRII